MVRRIERKIWKSVKHYNQPRLYLTEKISQGGDLFPASERQYIKCRPTEMPKIEQKNEIKQPKLKAWR